MSPTFVVASDGSLYWEGKRRRSGGYAVVTQDGVLLDGARLHGLRAVDTAEHLGVALALGRAVEALGGRYGSAVVVTDQLSVVERPHALHDRLHVADEHRPLLDAAQEMVRSGHLHLRYSTSHKPTPYQHAMEAADRLAAGFAVGLVTVEQLGTVPVLPTGGECRREWQRQETAPPDEHRRVG